MKFPVHSESELFNEVGHTVKNISILIHFGLFSDGDGINSS